MSLQCTIDQSVAIGPSGVATIAYTDFGGQVRVMQRTRMGWTTPSSLPVQVRNVDVDMGKGGIATLIWQTARRKLQTTTFSHGQFGEPRLIPGPRKFISSPNVAASRDGSATFTWAMGRPNRLDAVKSVHQSPRGRLSRRSVIAPVGPLCSNLAVSNNRRGDAAIAWAAPPNKSTSIQLASLSRDSHQWSEVSQASDGQLGYSCGEPALAVARDGSIVVAWQDFDETQPTNDFPPYPIQIVVRRTTAPVGE